MDVESSRVSHQLFQIAKTLNKIITRVDFFPGVPAAAHGAAQSLRLGRVQQLDDQIREIVREERRDVDAARHDLLVDFHRLLGREGLLSGRHLEEEYPQRPIIHRPVMAIVEHNLGR